MTNRAVTAFVYSLNVSPEVFTGGSISQVSTAFNTHLTDYFLIFVINSCLSTRHEGRSNAAPLGSLSLFHSTPLHFQLNDL